MAAPPSAHSREITMEDGPTLLTGAATERSTIFASRLSLIRSASCGATMSRAGGTNESSPDREMCTPREQTPTAIGSRGNPTPREDARSISDQELEQRRPCASRNPEAEA